MTTATAGAPTARMASAGDVTYNKADMWYSILFPARATAAGLTNPRKFEFLPEFDSARLT